MKLLMSILCVTVLLFVASTAAAADLSQDTLASMGLSGIQAMTDDAGMQVKGEGAWLGACISLRANCLEFSKTVIKWVPCSYSKCKTISSGGASASVCIAISAN
jgi:hypothetical protein